MKNVVMDPEIYKQLGELKGRFNTFENNMKQEFVELKQTIKEQSVVPYGIYEARVKATDIIHQNHEDRLKSIEGKVDVVEDTLQIREHTTTGKLAVFLDNAIVKVIGGSVILLVIAAMYYANQSQIKSLESQIDSKPVIIQQP